MRLPTHSITDLGSQKLFALRAATTEVPKQARGLF